MAQEWQCGLVGITVEQVKFGIDALTVSILKKSGESWPPAWPDFRKLCLSQMTADVPTLDETVSILVLASSRRGSLVMRYRHSLVLAIAHDVDMFSLRTANTPEAKRMIKPVYEQLLSSGWEDWHAHAHEEQKAITVEKQRPNKATAMSMLSAIRSRL